MLSKSETILSRSVLSMLNNNREQSIPYRVIITLSYENSRRSVFKCENKNRSDYLLKCLQIVSRNRDKGNPGCYKVQNLLIDPILLYQTPTTVSL